MPVEPGTRLGPYEILSAIGAGGMGEVYRATDTALGRQVAIKVLPEACATDPERLARFEREAKTLAALNHPNIAQIYGVEKSSGVQALVMELVDGEDLAQRLARGPIPLDEALPIAKQIAEALEAAHEQGIVHRDLKPANIKVRADGTVKVLDFGLAKLSEGGGASGIGEASGAGRGAHARLSMSPTITSPALMTGVGVLLGTAAYMSPEQAKGRPADKRSDIWAFGCVLFEMLTGKRTFGGETITETLAAVLKSDADWTLLPAAAPAEIRRLLQRCLRKDPRQRLADASAVRIELEDAMVASNHGATTHTTDDRKRVSLRLAVSLSTVAFAVGAVVALWMRSPVTPAATPSLMQLTIPLSPGTELGDGSAVAISPDGTQIAYVASREGIEQLYLRPISKSEARAIPDTRGAASPFFSPDGQWLGFFAEGKLKKVSTTTGIVMTLADAVTFSQSGTWGPDNTIVFTPGPMIVSAQGGQPQRLFSPQQAASIGGSRSVQFLPGGTAVLLGTTPPDARTLDEASIDVLTIKTHQLKSLVRGASQASYLPSGHLVYIRDGTLMAVPLDLEHLELGGAPVKVLTGVRQQLFNGVAGFSCSREGTCVYIAGGTAASRTVALVDHGGVTRTLPLPAKSYTHPRFSPTGNRIAWWIEQFRCDIEVYDVARGTVTRLTSDFDNHFPVWRPDGRLTYTTNRSGAYEIVSRQVGGGSEDPESKSPLRLTATTALSWSSNGLLAFGDRRLGRIRVLSQSGESDSPPSVAAKANESMPAFSPDGRWLAYVSDESGRLEVYVRPYPGSGGEYAVSTAGGSEPVWAHNERALYFRNGDRMMVADIGSGPAFSASRPRLLFSGAFARSGNHANYDVSPDDESFVMLNSGEEDQAVTQIGVLQNWFGELKRLVPTN